MAVIQLVNVSTANDGLGDTLRASQVKANENNAELNSKKVEVVAGKGLSSNDYTTTEKTKLTGIAPGAEVNVQANWNQQDTTADDYIIGKPTINDHLYLDQIITVNGTQTFTLPVLLSVCLMVLVNGQEVYKTTANNTSLVNRWSQTGLVVTLTFPTKINNYIYIVYI
tara:strand:+ start:4999 stop:5502 length:504 start_codon:yes stop_codon:yes gene_type:complete